MEVLTQEKKITFFDELHQLNITQTSLFLLNYIGLFKKLEKNMSTLQFLYNNGLVNTYLFNDDISYHYNNSIYLIFDKKFSYNKNIIYNSEKINIVQLLEDNPKTLDFYADDYNYIFTFRSNQTFNDNLEKFLNGEYLKLDKLHSQDTISNFVNNLINKRGLYKVMCNQLGVKDIPKPFLKLEANNESYSEDSFKRINSNDFNVIRKYSI
jgi:hypothetical protein